MAPHLRIAASQFPVSGNLTRNVGYIERQMREAAAMGVHVIHFAEASLPGYAPVHAIALNTYPWAQLEEATQRICDLAASLNLWTVVGSMRRRDDALPRNCTHVISNRGLIAGTYDKQRLYRGEKAYFSPGSTPLVLELNGFRCGFLICYDNCYPELYDAYRKKNVGLLFHSFHNAGNARATSIKDLMRATLIVRAADHQMWISAANSSIRYSPLPACIARPDGSVISTQRHSTGFVVDDYPLAELGWTYDNSTT